MSLTHGQEVELKEAFALFDTTNSGTIKPQDFADFVAKINDPELSKNLKLPTQPVDYKTFVSLVSQKFTTPEVADNAYGALFRSINKDGNGNISATELRAALQSFGNSSLSEADIDEIIHEADVSGDGRITLEEFLKIMTKSEKKLRGEYVL